MVELEDVVEAFKVAGSIVSVAILIFLIGNWLGE